MNKVEVSNDALDRISSLRNGSDMERIKSDIADSLSTLAEMINAGRDEEVINVWADELLKVMYVLGEYNDLVNALCYPPDYRSGVYMFSSSISQQKETRKEVAL